MVVTYPDRLFPAMPPEVAPATQRPTAWQDLPSQVCVEAMNSLANTEQLCADLIREAEQGMRKIETSITLTEVGKRGEYQTLADRIIGAFGPVAQQVDRTLTQRWLQARAAIDNAIRQREASRTPGETSVLLQHQNVMLALDDTQRGQLITKICQRLERRPLEALAIWPASFDEHDGSRLSGLVEGVNDRTAIAAAYALAIAGEHVADRDCLFRLAAAGAWEVSFAIAHAEQRLGAVGHSTKFATLTNALASWQAWGLDTFSDHALKTFLEDRSRKRQDAKAELEARAKALVVGDAL